MIETEYLTRFTLRKQTNVEHVLDVNDVPFEIQNVTPSTRISVSSVNFSLCSSLTR